MLCCPGMIKFITQNTRRYTHTTTTHYCKINYSSVFPQQQHKAPDPRGHPVTCANMWLSCISIINMASAAAWAPTWPQEDISCAARSSNSRQRLKNGRAARLPVSCNCKGRFERSKEPGSSDLRRKKKLFNTAKKDLAKLNFVS